MKEFFFAVCLYFAVVLPVFADEITVAAAANVQFTLEELAAAFEKDNPDIQIKTVSGSSGMLTAQIENGAPFDIFLSADMEYPQAIHEKGLAAQAPKIYVYGTLVLWTLGDFDLSRGVEVLTDPAITHVAIANPETAPYGRQAVNVLKFYNLYPDISPKLVYGESISQVNPFITEQAADIGFTAASVVLAPGVRDKGKWVEVDSKSYRPIAQGVVLLKDRAASSRAFYDFISSEKAGVIFKKYGYILP